MTSLPNVRDEKKIKAFDTMHKVATQYIADLRVSAKENGEYPKDGDSLLAETLLRECLGPQIFDVINSLV